MADIRNLDLNLLKAFEALMEERSVTRAAVRLALTQPAVSGMLTRLRENLDDPLFVRAQHGMIPTARALELAGPVKRVLGEIEALLLPPSFEPTTASLTLRVASTDYALRAVIVPFLKVLKQLAPQIQTATRMIDNDQAPAQLERGDIDLALMTPETAPPELHARRLFDEHYVCAMRRDHPDGANGSLSLDRFCALDHALVSYTGDAFRGATDAALEKVGRRRRVTLSVSSFLVLPEILRTTDLIAIVPRRLVLDTEGLRLLDPPLEIPGFTKVAVWHERTHRDPGKRWARTLMFDTCAKA
jgi:DNA-binding transcriptional LysR family regulator